MLQMFKWCYNLGCVFTAWLTNSTPFAVSMECINLCLLLKKLWQIFSATMAPIISDYGWCYLKLFHFAFYLIIVTFQLLFLFLAWSTLVLSCEIFIMLFLFQDQFLQYWECTNLCSQFIEKLSQMSCLQKFCRFMLSDGNFVVCVCTHLVNRKGKWKE